MPLYEYECDACGQRFEVIKKFSDPPADVCAVCGKGPVHRLLSSPAIHFKGSGWYITDYAQKKADTKTESKAESKTEAKTETKPETKGEAKSDTKGETKAGTEAKP